MHLSRLLDERLWFGVALCILLPVNIASVATSNWFLRLPKPVGDGVDYENIAFHLYHGHGYFLDSQNPQWRAPYEAHASAYESHLTSQPRQLWATGRPPLLPTLLAGIYSITGRGMIAFATVRLMWAACLALAGALATATVAQLLGPRGRVGPVVIGCATTLLLCASNRTLRTYATDFLTEPLALLMTQVLVMLLIADRPRVAGVTQRSAWSRSALEGAVLATMILTRSLFVLWLPGMLLLRALAGWGTEGWRAGLKHGWVMVGAACLLCSPWWIHNCVTLQRWMPLGTQGPITLVGGYSDAALAAGGDWQFEPEQRLRARLQREPSYRAAENDTQREVIVAQAARGEVRRWIATHREELPLLAWRRVVTHWNPYTGRSLVWKVLILLGAIGLALRCRDKQFPAWRAACWMLGLPLVSTLLAAVLYTTGGRFLVPLYGVLFTLAGVGVGEFAMRMSDRGLWLPRK